MSGQSPSTPYNVGGFGHAPQESVSRKRSRPDEHLQPDLPALDQPSDLYGHGPGTIPVHHPPQGYPLQPYPPAPPQAAPTSSFHRHRLPGPPPSKRHNTMEGAPSSPPQTHGPPSVVGQEGMPPPAPRPRGPKLKFTPEDDQLLVDLKEKKNLTWKQIAEFFPGRSSGTLQVRYCTKLKAKTTHWTDEMVQKLRNAMQEYENDRWRIIASKVGQGFTPAACREKAAELEALEAGGQEEEESGYTQTGSSEQQAASFQ
ncbi:uncharacterized protein EI97DRAFT_223684 [Westerdykella ornata]|uniref:Myb-like domain-containing protein n=1 Tax=Westerdykella ornata TaxID=318751 RepID=A0A6A6JRN8_WESOR|nr:uncharacterized protein EI97DRAFT_223684 [Westerdykella ornata]KAF2278934.1 hypothetical protein EI97DRAFT_223684 [Westerdykella ornata]